MGETIGIRREDKNKWERRVPIVPEDMAGLIKDHGLKFEVEPSPIRIFPDAEFTEAGAEIKAGLADCGRLRRGEGAGRPFGPGGLRPPFGRPARACSAKSFPDNDLPMSSSSRRPSRPILESTQDSTLTPCNTGSTSVLRRQRGHAWRPHRSK